MAFNITWEHKALVIDSIVKKIQNNIIVLKRELRWMYAFCCGFGTNVSTRLKQTSFIFGSSINLLYFNQVIRRAYTTRYFLSLEIVCKNHQTFLFYLKRIFYHQRLFARIITYLWLYWKRNSHILPLIFYDKVVRIKIQPAVASTMTWSSTYV